MGGLTETQKAICKRFVADETQAVKFRATLAISYELERSILWQSSSCDIQTRNWQLICSSTGPSIRIFVSNIYQQRHDTHPSYYHVELVEDESSKLV